MGARANCLRRASPRRRAVLLACVPMTAWVREQDILPEEVAAFEVADEHDVRRDCVMRDFHDPKRGGHYRVNVPLGLGVTRFIATRADQLHCIFMAKLPRRWLRLLADTYHTPSDCEPGTWRDRHFMSYVKDLGRLQERYDAYVPTQEFARVRRLAHMGDRVQVKLCHSYRDAERSCDRGARCRHLHAGLVDMQRFGPHVPPPGTH